MPDNCIDVIITSPPYNKAGYEGFIRKRHATDSWSSRNVEYDGEAENDFMIESEYQLQQIKVLDEMYRILKPNGSVWYNHKIRVSKHKASHPIEWIIKSKLNFRQQITWNRKGSPAVAPIRYLPTTELIFCLTKTACQPNFLRNKDSLFLGEVWDCPVRPDKSHPAPFPEELPTNILMCLKDTEDIIVYDPYSGKGTTCAVAKKLGFSYIGSEITEKYYDISNENLI